jgi:peptidoglycan/LPS O-acetylase OafA/YrhL
LALSGDRGSVVTSGLRLLGSAGECHLVLKAEVGLTVRDNNFELLRLFGATLVLYGHSYALTGSTVPGFAGTSVSTIGVKIFFSISGYLITLSWLRDPNLLRFLVRRAARIFPALIVVVLLSIFVLGPVFTRLHLADYFRNRSTWRYLENATLYINYFLPGVFETNTYPNAINGSLWSLPVEFVMYLATPIVLALTAVRRPLALATLATASTVFVLWRTQVVPPANQFVFFATDVWAGATLTPYFLVGMVFAVLGERMLNAYMAIMALFVLALVQTSEPVEEALLILALPYASLAFGVGPSLQLLPKGVDLSYGVFLFGFPVQQVVSFAFKGAAGPWLLFSISLGISAMLAALSWRFVEKPCLRLKPRPIAARVSNAASSPRAERLETALGSGLIDHSQKMTVAAMQIAEK